MSKLIDGLTPAKYLTEPAGHIQFDRCEEAEFVDVNGVHSKLLIITVSSDAAAAEAFVTFVSNLGDFDYFAMVRGEQVKVWRPDPSDDAGIAFDGEMPLSQLIDGGYDAEIRTPMGEKWSSIPFSDEDRARLGPDWPIQLVHGVSGKRVEVRCGGSVNAVDRDHPALQMVRELDQTQAVLVCDDGKAWFSIDGAGNWVPALYAPA